MKQFLGIALLARISDAQHAGLENLARHMNKPLFDSEQGFFTTGQQGWGLVHDGCRLELRHYGPDKIGSVYAQLHSDDIQRRVRNGRKQAFARAIGLHKKNSLQVLDATAGLGRDSAVLARLGCSVCMIERQPVIHALLADACLQSDDSLSQRLQLLDCQSANDYLARKEQCFDVVYLDPMYPRERRKALPKMALQLLRELSGDDKDAGTLLSPALGIAQRVVVKRSPHAAFLDNKQPTYQLNGNRVRYDVYLAPV